jgi:tyrosyl-DNA phosphodiesterase-1
MFLGEPGTYDDVTRSNPNLTFLTPKMPLEWGVHHTKMMVLFYSTGDARAVIHTANLIEQDWKNKSQGVWISPLLSAKPLGSSSSCQFEDDFVQYLEAYKEEKINKLAKRLRKLDFSKCRAVIVASVPGRHSGTNKEKWGHVKSITHPNPSVRNELSKVSIVDSKHQDLIFQFSSIGTLGKPAAWLTGELQASFSTGRYDTGGSLVPKLIFPTSRDVQRNYDGWAGGGSLPFREVFRCVSFGLECLAEADVDEEPFIQGILGRISHTSTSGMR